MNKKTGASGKHIVKRVDTTSNPKEEHKAPKPKPEPEKPRMPERTREKDPGGFGVIKTVALVVVALIIGSAILFRQVGGRETSRGNKLPGEQCGQTMECSAGSVCFSYKAREMRCMKLCGKDKICEPGYTCVSASESKVRKGIRVMDVCVENAKL